MSTNVHAPQHDTPLGTATGVYIEGVSKCLRAEMKYKADCALANGSGVQSKCKQLEAWAAKRGPRA